MIETLIGPAIGACFVIGGQLLQSKLAADKKKKEEDDKASRIRTMLYGQLLATSAIARETALHPVSKMLDLVASEVVKVRRIIDDSDLLLCLLPEEIEKFFGNVNIIEMGIAIVNRADDGSVTNPEDLAKAMNESEKYFKIIRSELFKHLKPEQRTIEGSPINSSRSTRDQDGSTLPPSTAGRP